MIVLLCLGVKSAKGLPTITAILVFSMSPVNDHPCLATTGHLHETTHYVLYHVLLCTLKFHQMNGQD